MKYGELIAFDPIDSVKVLRDADDIREARRDIETLVVSPRLAEQLTGVILPNLNLDDPRDPKGILVVAHYGTGKTHLMSVVSSIAEHDGLLEALKSDAVRTAAQRVAGRYQVIRAEIGATKMSLRDIITTELSEGLRRIGVAYDFPDISKVTNTKKSLEEMMQVFEQVHGDQGLLFVLDEMLDYLASRRDNELRVDLAVLREIGEICKSTRFRFIGGVQEAIFDSPRFASAADAVMRVKERFTQMRISRDDIAYVVEERLFRKTPEQKIRIRRHLQQFTPAYEGMAENLEAFVSLYPVHPAYLKTFELVTLVEKRKVLTTLSTEMRQLFETEVPENAPGLICFDTYRAQLEAEPSNRSIPDVREVLDRASVLRARVEKALPNRAFIPTALRIVDALTVHRLTTDDINAPIGLSFRELRDDLTLLPPGCELDAVFIEMTVQTVIEDIIRAVSGQFITVNDQNGQVYLDVRKDIDYDQKIDERAGSLDKAKLDEAYFKALETVLQQRDNPYVAGYKIWSYELLWGSRNVGRLGYLFMGAPNERSTAQPPRDFYVYFLQPYDPPKFTDEEKPDEVFFRLAKPDDDFTGALRRYAGAVALEDGSTGQHRAVYAEKRQVRLREMVLWLRKHMGDAVTVTYEGVTKPLGSWLQEAQGPRSDVKEQIDTIAAHVLVPHFEGRYPSYPAFTGATVTETNLAESVRQALLQVTTGRPNALSSKLLAALKLVDLDANLVDNGEFAIYLLSQLGAGNGKASNRDAIFEERDPGVVTWGPWHLEPAWFVVIAAALTQLGKLELGFSDGQLDALALEKLTRLSFDELEAVTHVAPPKQLPISMLRDAAALVGVPKGRVPTTGATEALVQKMQTECINYAKRIVKVRSTIIDGLTLWGGQVIENQMRRAAALKALEDIVNDIRARNTVGKLNKLNLTSEQLTNAAEGKRTLAWVEESVSAYQHLSDVTAYLRESVEVFGQTDPISVDAQQLRTDILQLLRLETIPDSMAVAKLRQVGEDLRRRFSGAAAQAHAHNRLDGAGDDRKRRIREGIVFADLTALLSVSMVAGGKYSSLQQKLVDLGTCKTFDSTKLLLSVVCADCGYRPMLDSGPTALARLDQIEHGLISLRAEWQRAVVDAVGAAVNDGQAELLKPEDRKIVNAFLGRKRLPDPVDDDFVRAMNAALDRFEVRHVSGGEIWSSLFPEPAPATLDELRDRFAEWLKDVTGLAQSDKVRIMPDEEGAE